MGLRNRLRFLTRAAELASEQPVDPVELTEPDSQPRAQFTVTVPPELSGMWTTASGVRKVSRADALSVPAVLKARNLICGGLGVLPLHVIDRDRRTVPSNLLDQPELGVPRSVTMTMLYEDLLFEGIAWWRIKKYAWTTYPDKVERLGPERVDVLPTGQVTVDGRLVTDADKTLIRFDSPNPGLLTVGARAIRTCLLLDQTAAMYAAQPLPTGYLEAPADATLTAEVMQATMDSWNERRASNATAGLSGGVKYVPLQWSPEQLQLADGRQHAVLEIARLTGVSPEDLGVSTTSRSYSNLEMDEQKFVTETLSLYGQAVAERLSMGDTTPGGYRVRVEYAGRLRTDTKGRYEAYGLGLTVGALGKDEIRELEDKPALTASQRVDPEPTPAPAATPPAPEETPAMTRQGVLGKFTAAGETVTLAFAPSDVEEFRADPERRTVSGMLLPFNVQTTDGRQVRFATGSITWQRAAVSRVKLDREHDLGQLLGSATRIATSEDGVSAAFKVAKTPAGDEALALAADGALDGLSAVVSITDAIPDPVHEGGTLVTSAQLIRATLTAQPAFDDARLTGVKLSSEGTPAMPCSVCGATHAAGTPCAARPAPAPAPDMTQFTASISDAIGQAFEAVASRLAAPQEREVVPAGRAMGFTVTEPPVYTFEAGHGPSIVRDTFNARANGDLDATNRLRKFAAQQAELAQFATVNRTVGANVIPPGYRPDLYVPQLFQGRPLFDMLTTGTLTDATPFTIPKFGSVTGGSADHTEGTNPTDGTLAFSTSITVTPGAVSGRFRITREIIDSSNPAIDAIAMAAMRESYSQQTEGKVYTALNGATGVGGVITSGFVPSGAAAVTATGVGSTGAAGVALLDTLRDQIVAYPFRRFAPPNRLALAQEAATQFAKAKDSTGRPLLPRLGVMNSVGTVQTLNQAFDVDGLPGVPAWSMTGNAAGDADTIMWNANDVWAWESAVSTFRYEEVAGPANVDLVLFAYFAVAVIRASGLSAIRLTVT